MIEVIGHHDIDTAVWVLGGGVILPNRNPEGDIKAINSGNSVKTRVAEAGIAKLSYIKTTR